MDMEIDGFVPGDPSRQPPMRTVDEVREAIERNAERDAQAVKERFARTVQKHPLVIPFNAAIDLSEQQRDAAVREILGAIVYLGGALLHFADATGYEFPDDKQSNLEGF